MKEDASRRRLLGEEDVARRSVTAAQGCKISVIGDSRKIVAPVSINNKY